MKEPPAGTRQPLYLTLLIAGLVLWTIRSVSEGSFPDFLGMLGTVLVVSGAIGLIREYAVRPPSAFVTGRPPSVSPSVSQGASAAPQPSAPMSQKPTR